MNAQEQADDAIQSIRDQGIADACAGRQARYILSSEGCLFERLGNNSEWLIPTSSADYRAAFAYARAFEANAHWGNK